MGDAVLYFEDVSEGDEAPVLTHVLTRTDLVAYAGASADFNPMHHDEVAAVAAGQPSVFGHGMFRWACWAPRSPTTWASATCVGSGCGSARPGPTRSSVRRSW